VRYRYELALILIGVTTLACIDITPADQAGAAGQTPTSVSATSQPPLSTPAARRSPSPTTVPTATPVVEIPSGGAIVVGGEVRTRSQPSSKAGQVGYLPDQAAVSIAARVQGENWLVGSQTWVTSVPNWATEWFRLADGSYIYGAFVFILQPGEVSPIARVPDGAEKRIDVDISEQVARAVVGDKVVFTAPISSGQAPFKTPLGSFAVEPDGRIAVERMTASQAGYDPRQTQYDVERVLFTQYFDRSGDALHLNYWRPHSVFGRMATSHGCIGLELHEAQYLWLFAQAGTKVDVHD
jgi:lipoprotein-anchoring transpeptidase ErfK/SrfK